MHFPLESHSWDFELLKLQSHAKLENKKIIRVLNMVVLLTIYNAHPQKEHKMSVKTLLKKEPSNNEFQLVSSSFEIIARFSMLYTGRSHSTQLLYTSSTAHSHIQ